MDMPLRTYCITDAGGRAQTVHRSDAFIDKLCLGIAGGGFSTDQTRIADRLRHALLVEGRSIGRNGCTIRLVAGDVRVLQVGEEVGARKLH